VARLRQGEPLALVEAGVVAAAAAAWRAVPGLLVVHQMAQLRRVADVAAPVALPMYPRVLVYCPYTPPQVWVTATDSLATRTGMRQSAGSRLSSILWKSWAPK
jgi:hypothetical protein